MTTINFDQTRQAIRQWWFIPFCVGALIVLVWGRYASWPSPIVERDLHQHRGNLAAPLPDGDLKLSQTFRPQKNGFSEIEVWLVRYGEPQPESDGVIIFSVHDAEGALIAEERRRVANHNHNDGIKISFLPQENSAEKTYTFTVAGINNSAFSVAGYTLNALDGAFTLSNGEPHAVQDLRLTTRYTLTPNGALRTLATLLRNHVTLFVATTLLVTLPGVLLFAFLPNVSKDSSTNWAIYLALGCALWPIIWTWTTVVGFAWGRGSIWALMVVGWVVVVMQSVRRRRASGQFAVTLPSQHTFALFFLLFFCFVLRLLAARDLVFPPWVDSIRHVFITNIMQGSGQILQGYQPHFDVSEQLYHFGFHSIAASLGLLLDSPASETLLMMGQLFNALILLTIYGAGYLLTRRQGVGLLAAFIVGLPMFFPAYYMSWGRLTQLVGMLIMSILLGLTWRLAREKTSAEIQLTILVGILASGLFFVHFRVFLLYVPFALFAWLFGRPNRFLPLAGIFSLLLSLPRIIQFARLTRIENVLRSSPSYNKFPIGYITTAWETPILILTIACVVLVLLHFSYEYPSLNWIIGLGLLAATLVGEWLGFIPILFNIPFLRTGLVAGLFAFVLSGWQQPLFNWPLLAVLWLALGHLLETPTETAIAITGVTLMLWTVPHLSNPRWRMLTLLNALWVGTLFLLLLGERIGLPESWVVNTNSMVITLFLPYALIIALTVWALWGWFQQQHWIAQIVLYAAFGSLIMYTLLFSVPHQINILNQTTVLVEAPDIPAMAWLDENLPQDAIIAVSSWHWLGSAWSAQDGGAMLYSVFSRRSTMPPPDYTVNPDLRQAVNGFNERASAVSDWSTPEAAELLREHDVTYIYIGSRGGFLNPEQIAANAATTLLYAEQGAFVFALR